MHHAFKKPPSFENRGTTGVCLGHDTRIAGGVLVVSVANGELKEVCSAKVRKLGEKVGQAWRLHVHPQDSSRSAYVNRKSEVKWNLQHLDVPTVEQCVKEDALEVHDIRELGLGWAWFVNDLRAFLPAWQDMELATPSTEEPVTQIAGDVPMEPLPLHADATQMEMELQAYERPLAVTPFGAPEIVPIGKTAMLCVPTFHPQPSDNGFELIWVFAPFRVWARMLPSENKWFVVLHGMLTHNRSSNPCHVKSISRCHCIDAVYQALVHTLVLLVIFRLPLSIASSHCPSFLLLFLRSCLLPLFLRGRVPIFAIFYGWCL